MILLRYPKTYGALHAVDEAEKAYEQRGSLENLEAIEAAWERAFAVFYEEGPAGNPHISQCPANCNWLRRTAKEEVHT